MTFATRTFTASGAPASGEVVLGTSQNNGYGTPSVTVAGTGYAVGYQSDTHGMIAVLNASGAVVSNVAIADGAPVYPQNAVADLSNGTHLDVEIDFATGQTTTATGRFVTESTGAVSSTVSLVAPTDKYLDAVPYATSKGSGFVILNNGATTAGANQYLSFYSLGGTLSGTTPTDSSGFAPSGQDQLINPVVGTTVLATSATLGIVEAEQQRTNGSVTGAVTLRVYDLANTAPVLTGSTTTVAFTQAASGGNTPVAVAGDYAVTDDGGVLYRETVSIASGFAIGDVLTAALSSATGNITSSYNGGTGTLTLTSPDSTATLAQFQAALRSVTYTESSNTTSTATRTISTVANDYYLNSNTLSRSVTITGVSQPPVAVADSATTAENATVAIAVVANDTDTDGGPKAVASINGTAVSAGGSVTLASGAIATLNADGTIGYNPNHAFDYLISPAKAMATGASDSSAADSFTYALNGGSSATVSVTVTGVDGAGDQLRGGSGNDTITGPATATSFDLSQGGNDTVRGGAGDDAFYFGAALTNGDRVDGGGGTNQVAINGDYTGSHALTLGPGTLTNIQALVAQAGHSYTIYANDATVAPGQTFTVYGANLGAGDNLTFYGNEETNGSFRIFGGAGIDTLIGGAGNDAFYFGPGKYGASDTVHGGGGANDQLVLDGNYTTTLDGRADVETVVLAGGPSDDLNHFNITVADGFVAAGTTKTIFAIPVSTSLTIDASASTTDGSLVIFGGSGGGTIIGGAGADTIYGGSGQNTLTGGGGSDTFRFDAVTESKTGTPDTITDFTLGDVIDLHNIDAIVGNADATGNDPDDAFTFIGSAAFGHHAGELHYVSGSNGQVIVSGDVDGDGVADFAIALTIADHHTLTTGDFHL